jgi:hydrogenase maturation factor
MAINKNFVVKNGIEVNTNLIVADTDSNKVGIGTTVPEYTLHVFQGTGIGATTINVTGVGTFLEELNVGLAGTTLTAISNVNAGIAGSVGVGTDAPGYLLEVHSPVTTGQTALYVRGDMVVTGDINIDDISIGDLNVSGISTFVGNILIGTGATVGFGSTAYFKDHAKAIFGDGEDLKVYHDGSNSYISDTGTGGLIVGSNSLTIKNAALNETQAVFTENGSVELYHDNGKRFNTNAIGVEVSGTLQSTGITTLASSGGITTTGGDLYVGGDLFINEDIVLDTNLEILGIATVGSIHVTGISTFDGELRGPNLTNSVVVGTGLSVRGSATGVAVTLAGAGGITTTGGDLYVGGDLFINEDIILDTNLTILGIATIGSLNLSSTSGINTIDSTVQSTSKDTGSLVLQGGLGVEKQLYVGAGASVGAGLTVAGNLLPEADGTRDLGASGKEWKDLYIDGTANIDSLSADTAAIGDLTDNRVVIAGSSGELEDSADLTFDGTTLAVNAVFDSNDATQSSSSTTGAAQFAGGVGVAKNLYVGGGQVTTGIHTITDLRVGTQLAGQSLVGITTILDEDNMASNSAAALATQQSIKAYVDAQVTASDLDFQGDSGGAQSVDLDSQTFTIAGTTNEIETSSSGQTLTVGLPNDVTIGNDLTVTNNVSIASSVFHTGDLNSSFGFPANDTFTVYTDGSERVRIDSAGRMGLGISPSDFGTDRTSLEIHSASATVTHLSLTNSTTGSNGASNGFNIIQNGNNALLYLRESGFISFSTNNAEAARITSSGSVGINTTPGTLLELQGTSSKEADVTFNREPAQGTNDGVIGQLLFENHTDSVAQISVKRESAADDAYIQFATQTTGGSFAERLRITSDGKVRVPDNGKFTAGAGDDLQIYHDGSNSYIKDAGTGILILDASQVQIKNAGSTENCAKFLNDGAVELYYDNSLRLETTTDGADFSGTGGIKLPVGTTAQRNGSPVNGDIRYNTDLNSYEGYGNGAWGGLGGGTEIDTAVSSTSATNITTFAHASYRSASLRIQITQGSSYQVGKYLLIHDGTTVTVVEESAIATGDMLGSISGAISGSNVEVKVTMNSASSATVTTIIDKITV